MFGNRDQREIDEAPMPQQTAAPKRSNSSSSKDEITAYLARPAVRGHVEGKITATQRVHLQNQGTLIGELTTPSLQMDENVTFDGSCSMPRKGENRSSSPSTPKNVKEEDKIADAVETVGSKQQ